MQPGRMQNLIPGRHRVYFGKQSYIFKLLRGIFIYFQILNGAKI